MEIPPLQQHGKGARTGKKLILEVAKECDQLPAEAKPVYPPCHNDYVVVQSVAVNEVCFLAEEHYRALSKTRAMIPTTIEYLKRRPRIGSLALVNARKPTRCYRVRVLRVTGNEARVYLIDIGETRTMEWTALSPMPDDWKRIPNALLKVRIIHDIMSPGAMQWLGTYAGGVRFWNLSVAPALTLSAIVKRLLED